MKNRQYSNRILIHLRLHCLVWPDIYPARTHFVATETSGTFPQHVVRYVRFWCHKRQLQSDPAVAKNEPDYWLKLSVTVVSRTHAIWPWCDTFDCWCDMYETCKTYIVFVQCRHFIVCWWCRMEYRRHDYAVSNFTPSTSKAVSCPFLKTPFMTWNDSNLYRQSLNRGYV